MAVKFMSEISNLKWPLTVKYPQESSETANFAYFWPAVLARFTLAPSEFCPRWSHFGGFPAKVFLRWIWPLYKSSGDEVRGTMQSLGLFTPQAVVTK
jgi:hypothetical protein